MSLHLAARHVRYDPGTGVFTSLDGRPLATKHPRGYVRVKVAGLDVLAHRLAWFIVYGREPVAMIDHKNRDRADNRIENLREATPSQNLCNRNPRPDTVSGVVGVARTRQGTKWQAYIKLNGKRKHLGVFADLAEAVAARKAAEPMMFGAFAPGG